MNPLIDEIDLQKMTLAQLERYSERVLMGGIVPANSEQRFTVDVTNLGAILTLGYTGSFTTLLSVPPNITDTGINYLFGRLLAGGDQRQLFSDFIPFNILFSPGRERSSLASAGFAGDPPNPLIYPDEFVYLFGANSSIQMDVRNTSNTDNSFNIAWKVIRIKTFGLSGPAAAGLPKSR